MREHLNSERFVDCAPRTVYATLLDEGVYLCHWRSMYRVLGTDAATRERRAVRRRPLYARPKLLATAPRQVWSWDSTKLRGPKPDMWFSLYVIVDMFSRAVVGWRVAATEDARLAEQLIAESCVRAGIGPDQRTLHADRGAPMTSNTGAALRIDRGVAKSHSRPTISNDNPYSEAQFTAMKYGSIYPDRCADMPAANVWVRTFIDWYNTKHRHSGIGLLPPYIVHQGKTEAAVAARQQTVKTAAAMYPQRFVAGQPKPPRVPDVVWINAPLAADTVRAHADHQKVLLPSLLPKSVSNVLTHSA